MIFSKMCRMKKILKKNEKKIKEEKIFGKKKNREVQNKSKYNNRVYK